ncbi:PREDICTED: avidin-like [Nanorana parkeri]|uniref:avidin-like n=1 Tax=Nanorana parkeri TaxID=125878 RepID=UPI000854842C|nr:PREDICTED: avidin-like [Nanorana parkeri]
MVAMKGSVLCMVLLWTYCSDVGAQCNMTGVWVNTLGSVLILHADGSRLSGSLRSSVELHPGSAGDQMTGKLMGVLGKGKQPTFSMSVSWKGETVTAWVGQCFQTAQCPVLRTMWLLRSPTTAEDNWKATRTGEDIYYPEKKCEVERLS